MPMATALNLDNQHADYTVTSTARTTGRDLCDGSDAVKAKTTTYLYQGKNETDADYAIRLNRAVFDPYIDKIITARQALLFRKEHQRELSGRASAYAEDVDRKGTPADVFFQRVARDAQIDGVRWVSVDMTTMPEGGYRSAGEEALAGHRPFFESVPGDNVLDWEVGDDEKLNWAVVKGTRDETRNYGYPVETFDQWKVWTRAEWFVFEQGNGETTEESTYTLVDQGINTCGEVPLVPFLGIKYSDYAGYPVCKPIFDHVTAIYNKSSDMDWFEYLVAHPIPYVISPEKPETLDVLKGTWIKSHPGGAPIQLGYLEPTGAGFSSQRESIHEIKAALYSIALAQAQKESAQIQAADSQREDRRIFTASLASISRQYESAELQCWRLLSAWLNERNADHSIAYNRDFDDAAIEATLVGALATLIDTRVLTRKTVLRTLVNGELVEVEDIDAELKAAAEEAERRNAVVGATANLIAQNGDDESQRAGNSTEQGANGNAP